MNSGTSTDSSGFRPWHFFVLVALISATAAVLMSTDTTPVNLILVSAAIGSAALAGMAFFRTLAPFAGIEVDSTQLIGERARAALEREKVLALRLIKELEFDRSMGKIAERDFDDQAGRLRARAIALIRQLDAGGGYRDLIERELQARLGSLGLKPSPGSAAEGPARQPEASAPAADPGAPARTCSACETGNDADARFCKQCGEPLAGPVGNA